MTNLSAYLTETATLYRRTGVNAYGEDLFDTGADLRCRVRLQRLAAHLAEGEERRVAGEIWLAPDQAVAPGDQVLYDGSYLRLTAVEAVLDVAGDCCGLRAKVG